MARQMSGRSCLSASAGAAPSRPPPVNQLWCSLHTLGQPSAKSRRPRAFEHRCRAAVAALAAGGVALTSISNLRRLRPRRASRQTSAVAASEFEDVGLRRRLLGCLGAAASVTSTPSWAKKRKCENLDDCRNEGDRRFDQIEAQKGPIIEMGKGIRYREVRVGTGPTIRSGDTVDITYEVRKTNGDYIYSLGRGRPDMQTDERPDDFGETYRVRLGQRDVPVAVEMAMEGMQSGGIRTVEFPPWLGFETSNWKPEPSNFSGKQRMERYRKLLTGNGLQAGYNAAIVLEVEVMRVKSQQRA